MKSFATLTFSIFVLGATSRAQAPLYDLPGATDDKIGSALAPIGDLDGDGHSDLLAGAPEGDGAQVDAGRVRVYSGKTGAFVLTLDGEFTGDRFGHSVASLGDITGDGVDDIVVGAPNYDQAPLFDRGAVYVFSGASGAQLWKHVGGSGGNHFGYVVAGAGDINHDGTRDIAFSAPNVTVTGGGTNQGYVAVYSGATFGFLRSWSGSVTDEELGYSLAAGGDFNSDGTPDLVAGAPKWDGFSMTDVGRVRVLSGAASATTLLTIAGSQANGNFGAAVGVVPDTTGDVEPEIAVGEPGFLAGSLQAGRVRVYGGPGFGLLFNWVGNGQERLGTSIAGLSDVNGDARGDVIVGAPGYENTPTVEAGALRVYSVFDQSELGGFLSTGYHSQALMGTSVASAGDLNNDGRVDLMGGAPGESNGFPNGGRIRVILGTAAAPANYCTAKVNSAGCTPFISYAGAASVSVGSGLAVVGANILANAKGVMIWSFQPTAIPFGGGTLCVAAPVKRTPVQDATNYPNQPCTGWMSYLVDQAYMSANNLVPGVDFFCQYWHRDNGFAPPNNMGLTNGLKVTVHP